jgi:hypothetical protein
LPELAALSSERFVGDVQDKALRFHRFSESLLMSTKPAGASAGLSIRPLTVWEDAFEQCSE